MNTSMIKNIFLKFGIYGLLRRLFPHKHAIILRYHAVVDGTENYYTSPPIALSPNEFEEHVKYFSKNYRVMSLDEIVEIIKQKKKLPRNTLAFTFDDGYADNLQAAKILHKFNATGTFYIVVEPVLRKNPLWLAEVTYYLLRTDEEAFHLLLENNKIEFPLVDRRSRWRAIRDIIRLIKSNNRSTRDTILPQLRAQLGNTMLDNEISELMLNREQVKQMTEMNMTIGSHTMTHLNLPNAEIEDAVWEIGESKKVLEKELGCKIKHFSYPNSGPYDYYNETIRDMVVKAGYNSATTSFNGFFTKSSDPYAIKRMRTVPDLAEVVHQMEWDRFFSRD